MFSALNLFGQPVPVLHHLHRKNFFCASNVNFPFFNFYPLLPVLSLQFLSKSLSLASLWFPFRYWKVVMKSPHNILFSSFNNLSLSSWRRHCSPLINPSRLAPAFPHLSLVAPELNAVLQVRCAETRAEGQKAPPHPAGHIALDAGQDPTPSYNHIHINVVLLLHSVYLGRKEDSAALKV